MRGTREAVKRIADRALRVRQRAYIFVDDRLEGTAPATIEDFTKSPGQTR